MKKGYYKQVEKTIHHDGVEGVKEQYHYEVIKVYENGGKDVKKVIDVEGVEPKEAYDEIVYEEVWVDYTEKELAQFRIEELKQLLKDTDYKAIKFAEGLISEEDYQPIKKLRQSYRDEINQLEAELNK